MNRRDFLERFVFALTAALFALLGIRHDVSPDDVHRLVSDTTRKLDDLANRAYVNATDYANILKELWPQRDIHNAFYGNCPSFGRFA